MDFRGKRLGLFLHFTAGSPAIQQHYFTTLFHPCADKGTQSFYTFSATAMHFSSQCKKNK